MKYSALTLESDKWILCQRKLRRLSEQRATNPAWEFREDFLEEVMAVLSLERKKDMD